MKASILLEVLEIAPSFPHPLAGSWKEMSIEEGVQSISIPSAVGTEVWEHSASQRVQQHAVHPGTALLHSW